MTFGEKLRALRDQRGWTQEQIANKLGTSKQVISRYENNQRSPKLSVALKYAEILGVSSNYFTDNEDSNSASGTIPPGFEPLPEMQLIPLVGEIACGMPITAEENLDGYVEAPKGRHIDFALTCKGESMIDAGISDGDVVFVRKQPTVENGQIAAVRVNGEATVKRVYINGNAMILQPANINFLPQTYAISELDDVAIEGLVVGWTHWV